MRSFWLLMTSALLLGIAVTLAPLDAQAQQINLPYRWANSGGGGFDDTGRGIALDNAGNVYVTGRFTSIGRFGPITLTGSSGSQDVFLVKYDPQGVVQWARRAGGIGDDSGIGVAVNAVGEVYLTGYFQEECSFDASSTTLTGYGSSDIFVAKYSSSGTLLWANGAGGAGNDEGLGISVSSQGAVTLAGFFDDQLTSGVGAPLVALGRHACVIRYTAQGQPQWARLVGGPTGTHGRGIAFDAAGAVYVTGNTVAVDGNNDGFLTKLDAGGTEVWSRFVGGDGFDRSISIATDAYGELVIAGLFEGTATFGQTTVTSSGDYDAFLAKYDLAGTLIWVRTAGGRNRDYAINLALDQYGNPLLTGFFTNSATFGTTVLTGNGAAGTSVFRAWYDWQGNPLGAETPGSSAEAIGYGVAIDAQGDTYLTGSFTGTVVLTPLTLVSTGAMDAFVGRVGSNLARLHPVRSPSAAPAEVPVASAVCYPNPAVAGADIHLALPRQSGPVTARLYDAQGRLVQVAAWSPSDLAPASGTFQLGPHAPGLYTFHLATLDRHQAIRLVIR